MHLQSDESVVGSHSMADTLSPTMTLRDFEMKRFAKVPHVRYINFVAEFFAANTGATRAEAIAAWTEIKELDVPKDYASWVKARAKRRTLAKCKLLTPRANRPKR